MFQWLLYAQLGIVLQAWAATLCVPQEYALIQTALNSLSSGDTVLVDSGLYAEALIAPPLVFWLIGNVESDSQQFQGPWIDPTSVPGSDTLAAFLIPANARVTVERIGFRNGAEMYPAIGTDRPSGGIVVHTTELFSIRDCVFDSVYGGLICAPGVQGIFDVERCRFEDCAVYSIWAGPITTSVRDCRFSMSTLRECLQIAAHAGPVIRRCLFQGQTGSPCIAASGSNLEISDCVFRNFGPADINLSPNSAIQIGGDTAVSGWIEGNTITDCELIYDAVHINLPCSGDNLTIRRNRISRCSGPGLAVLSGMMLLCTATPADSIAIVIEDNIFEDCSSHHAAKAILSDLPATVERNHFVRNRPDSVGVVGALRDGLVMHENVILDNIVAIDQFQMFAPDIMIHAERNFWGDSTGPLNEIANPGGLGDAVRGWNVFFTPWSLDTNFLAVPGLGQPLPVAFTLDAYPNPFNSTVTLKLIPSQVAIVKVELFNILGRRIKEIWSGALAYEKTISFDGSQLSSGIYFVRVWQPIGNRPLALQKLVLLK